MSRVRVEPHGARALVVTDVLLAGDAASAPALAVFAAYGAPGPALAVAAELIAVPAGHLSAPGDARGKRVPLEPVTRAPDDAALVLGPTNMAGSAARLSESELREALAASGAATLRVRAAYQTAAAETPEQRELLIRLGAQGETPLTLGLVELDGDAVSARRAWLCGPHAASTPLALAPRRADEARGLAPPLALRAADDALCVSWHEAQKVSAGDGVRPVDSR
ncbi:MAG: hypothetical protein OZ921_05095 [Sorangiineae bacterium]|nr:hypothetical protein [Sorangiineae bacterium]